MLLRLLIKDKDAVTARQTLAFKDCVLSNCQKNVIVKETVRPFLFLSFCI